MAECMHLTAPRKPVRHRGQGEARANSDEAIISPTFIHHPLIPPISSMQQQFEDNYLKIS